MPDKQPRPYDPSSLHPPLSSQQRSTIISWLHSVEPLLADSGPTSVLKKEINDNAAKDSDQALIGLYKLVDASTTGGTKKDSGTSLLDNVPNPITGFLDFANKLWHALTDPNFWLRVGEGILGLLLIGVGFVELTGKDIPVAGNVVRALK